MNARTAFVTHHACLSHDMGPRHYESPVRLAAIYEHMQDSGLLGQVDEVQAPRCQDETVYLRAHNAKLWQAIQKKSPLSGLAGFDNETMMCPDTLLAIEHAVGGTIEAVSRVCTGVNRNAFVAVRPPGHHATREKSMGFCFVNNASIGAYHALETLGLKRVAIVDIDVHHGNGTEQIIAGDERIFMASTFASGIYPGNGALPLGTNMRNEPLLARTNHITMRTRVQQTIFPALEAFSPELIIISAGYDAHEDDPLGNQTWTEADYGWWFEQLQCIADKHANGRMVAVLEGGYNPAALGRSVVASVKAMLGE